MWRELAVAKFRLVASGLIDQQPKELWCEFAVAKFGVANENVLRNLERIRTKSQTLSPPLVPYQKQALRLKQNIIGDTLCRGVCALPKAGGSLITN